MLISKWMRVKLRCSSIDDFTAAHGEKSINQICELISVSAGKIRTLTRGRDLHLFGLKNEELWPAACIVAKRKS